MDISPVQRAVLFVAYGTLFDVYSMALTAEPWWPKVAVSSPQAKKSRERPVGFW